jgi:hypothetical protein
MTRGTSTCSRMALLTYAPALCATMLALGIVFLQGALHLSLVGVVEGTRSQQHGTLSGSRNGAAASGGQELATLERPPAARHESFGHFAWSRVLVAIAALASLVYLAEATRVRRRQHGALLPEICLVGHTWVLWLGATFAVIGHLFALLFLYLFTLLSLQEGADSWKSLAFPIALAALFYALAVVAIEGGTLAVHLRQRFGGSRL